MLDPALEPACAGDIGKARGVVLVVQVAATIEQLELEPAQLRQILAVERAIGVDQLAGNALRIRQAQTLQVAHDLFDRFAVALHAPAVVLTRVGFGFLAQHPGQGGGVGQARAEAHRGRLQFRRQLNLVSHQHDHVRQTVAALDQVAQGALAAGIAQVGMKIEHHVHAALAGLADRLQGGAGIGRAFRRLLAVHIEAAQALGSGPAIQRTPYPRERLAEQIDDPGLILRFDHDQRGIGPDQCGQVLQFVHGATSPWGRNDNKGGPDLARPGPACKARRATDSQAPVVRPKLTGPVYPAASRSMR